MEKFDRQRLVQNLEKFHQTNRDGYESQCREIWKKMDETSCVGRKSIQHPLGHRTSNLSEFLDYIKERFPESDGYQYSRSIEHTTGCGFEDSFGCTEYIVITFL